MTNMLLKNGFSLVVNQPDLVRKHFRREFFFSENKKQTNKQTNKNKQ